LFKKKKSEKLNISSGSLDNPFAVFRWWSFLWPSGHHP